MQVIIDRFEGTFAIVEISVGYFAKIEKKLIPDAKEGDVVNISIDKIATEKRQKEVLKLVTKVFEE